MAKTDRTRWKRLAESGFARATSALDDAFNLDVSDVPGPVIHSCYLAMSHAAKSFVLFREGVAPKNRKDAIKRCFELFPKTAEARAYAEIIRNAESLNESEEYDGSVDILIEEVEELRHNTTLVLAFFAQLLDLEFDIADFE